MATAISKRHLSRRAFLRGTGAVLALPWLDAMLPACATRAQAAEATAAPKRFLGYSYGLGFHGPYLFPKDSGLNYTPSPYLEPLQEHRADFSVISGLSHPEQNGANGHTGEMTVFTSAKHPGLPGFKNTISIDQYLVEKLVPNTRFSSLQLSLGASESMSWSSAGVNLPAENSPEKLYAMLFVTGTRDQIAYQMSELKRGRSILDTLGARAKQLSRSLGARDQEKFDQYLTSVRELESRLQDSQDWAQRPKPQVDAPAPTDVADRLDVLARTRLMNEMIALALETDSTRIITVKSSAMGEAPKIPGVDTGWHELSHHGQDAEKIDELKRIELAEFEVIGEFLKRLKSVKEPSGSVLDNTSVLFTSNLGNASSHSWRDLPVVIAGGGFKHGSHIVAGGAGLENKRFSNLFVQIARKMGVDTESFGSSNGTTIDGLT